MAATKSHPRLADNKGGLTEDRPSSTISFWSRIALRNLILCFKTYARRFLNA